MTHYYFTKEDFAALNQEIASICDRIKEAGKEMGASCGEGAETFHDNFAYEEGERQQYMWSKRLRELVGIRNQSRVVEPQKSRKVSLGSIVTTRDTTTGTDRKFRIGSFMIFGQIDNSVISYNAPLAKMIIGAEVGDTREANIAGVKKKVEVIKIE